MMIEIIFSTPVPCDCACIKFRKILLRPVQVGLNISITANMIVASLLLFSVASVLSQVELTTYIFASCAKDIKFLIQDTPPPFTKIGCPAPSTEPFEGSDNCFVSATSCIPDRETWPDVVGFSKNNNVYKIIRARSWWHCGKIQIFLKSCIFHLNSYRNGVWPHNPLQVLDIPSRPEEMLSAEELLWVQRRQGLPERHKHVPVKSLVSADIIWIRIRE